MAKLKIPKGLSEYFSKLGRSGGKKAAQTMTAEQRRERARRAAAKSAEVRRKKAKS